MKDGISSDGFQHSQNRCGAKEVEPPAAGGDVLIGSSGIGESSATRRSLDRTAQPIAGT
jgi:hypothetical protein